MKNTELLTALRLIDHKKLIDDVAAWKMEQDKGCVDYQCDLYMHLSQDGSYTLETFVNVGGNSWSDDDHITLCSYTAESDMWDDIQDIAELADIIGEPLEYVIESVAEWASCDPEDVSLLDAIAWCKGCENDAWCDRIDEAWRDRIDEFATCYYDWAEYTVYEALDDLEMELEAEGVH